MQGYILKTDGTVEPAAEKLDLQGMYKAIGNGCHIVERVQLKHCEIWCDEEGLINTPRMINPIATNLYQAEHGPEVGIVGNAYVRVKKGYALDGGRIVRNGPKKD